MIMRTLMTATMTRMKAMLDVPAAAFLARAPSSAKDAALATYILACFFGVFFTVLQALENLRKKRFEIDTLMIAATIGVGILGH